MSGHTPWRKIKRKRSSPAAPILDHWRNLVAEIEVGEEVVEPFVDELMDRLPGAVLSYQAVGSVRQIELTIEAKMSRPALVQVIGETSRRLGAAAVFARVSEEYAWTAE